MGQSNMQHGETFERKKTILFLNYCRIRFRVFFGILSQVLGKLKKEGAKYVCSK